MDYLVPAILLTPSIGKLGELAYKYTNRTKNFVSGKDIKEDMTLIQEKNVNLKKEKNKLSAFGMIGYLSSIILAYSYAQSSSHLRTTTKSYKDMINFISGEVDSQDGMLDNLEENVVKLRENLYQEITTSEVISQRIREQMTNSLANVGITMFNYNE